MPSAPNHIVARYAMELDFMDRRAAQRGAEELMEASRQHIAAMIDACCNELVGPDEYITIPRLEIDLGTLDPLHLVDGYLERFKQHLRHQLKDALAKQSQADPVARALQVVADYGTSGQYPWWAGSPDPAILHAAVATVLRQAQRHGNAQLHALLGQGKLLQRLVLALPAAQIAAIWEQLIIKRPIRQGEANIIATSRLLLQNASAIDRRRWQEFAYQSIARAMHAASTASAAAILLWLQMETAVALPQALLSRLETNAGLLLQLEWMQNCLAAPSALVAAYLLAEVPPAHAGEQVVAAEAALQAWMKATWNLGSSSGEALFAAIDLALGEMPQAAPTALPTTAERITRWLQMLCDLPQGKYQDLLARVAAQYAAQTPESSQDASALTAWLHTQPALPPEAPALLAQVLLPILIAHGRSQQAAPNPPADTAALTPLLRAVLNAPRASLQELLQRLAVEASRHLLDNEPTSLATAAWLRSRYSLTAEMRTRVAEAVSALLLPAWRPPALQPAGKLQVYLPKLRELLEMPDAQEAKLLAALFAHFAAAHPTKAHDELQLMDWLQGLELPQGGDLQALATAILHLQTQAPRPARVPEKYPTLRPMLPWLRRKLDLAGADAEVLLQALLEQYYAAHPGVEPSQALMEQWLDRHLRMPKSKRNIAAQAMVQCAHEPKANSGNTIPQANAPRPSLPNAPTSSDLPYFVENAGLIIFWPMLQRYFQFQGLVEDKSFVSVLAQEQAVRLLQTLVMGDEEWNEAALALPKLLCGLAPDALVDPSVEVDAEMLAGIDTLVGAVLAHWTLAGELSVDGYRQAWLQRSGTLRLRDDHWLLRIEARGHDMILEGLPWDIAYIQLPWMRNVLYVDWGDKAKFNA